MAAAAIDKGLRAPGFPGGGEPSDRWVSVGGDADGARSMRPGLTEPGVGSGAGGPVAGSTALGPANHGLSGPDAFFAESNHAMPVKPPSKTGSTAGFW